VSALRTAALGAACAGATNPINEPNPINGVRFTSVFYQTQQLNTRVCVIYSVIYSMDIKSLRKGELGTFQKALTVLQKRKQQQIKEQGAFLCRNSTGVSPNIVFFADDLILFRPLLSVIALLFWRPLQLLWHWSSMPFTVPTMVKLKNSSRASRV
jgi:hypothetical protein